ncbi:nin one binding (NOB1) zn-ribbon like domain-containing protein [Sarocladium implicatum]|nr:nin one binding (NOB1) zn-ribbon like domain-containing protein [Sarocladium implicatum]
MSGEAVDLPSGTPVEPQFTKPIHSLVVDTGPLIKNDPLPTVLREKAEKLYTIPSVISEIRDAATKSRVETTLLPFLELRNPKPDSVAFVTGFARRTGDLGAISKTDLDLVALAYELECERNGGDWRLRKVPGQKRLNGRPPGAPEEEEAETKTQKDETVATGQGETLKASPNTEETKSEDSAPSLAEDVSALELQGGDKAEQEDDSEWQTVSTTKKSSRKGTSRTTAPPVKQPEPAPVAEAPSQEEVDQPEVVEDDEDSDDEGWITPSNLAEHQAADAAAAASADGKQTTPKAVTLQAALLTSDYAMQNVSLRMNLNLLNPSFMRVTRLKTWILRCHGCFATTKDMTKQFCPSCGQPTLLRTSCSTDERGQVRVHLKKNYQWNNRGNVYSVPKPTHGSSNGRLPPKGSNVGGKGGWGRDLMLAEDQKEYQRKGDEIKRERKKDLMDDDILPSILTGDRPGGSGKIKVGAGRNINSKRRR